MTALTSRALLRAPAAGRASPGATACLAVAVAVLAVAGPASAALYDVPAGGSLREAVIHANASAEDDVIHLAAGTFAFHAAGRDEDFAATGDLDIRGNLSLVGAGAGRTVVDAAGLDRVFQVFPGVRFDVSGVTITGGETGALFADGGGILSSGIVSLTDAVVSGNAAYVGGGLLNDGGTLTMTRAAVSGNVARAALFSGGGLVNINGGTASITRSTVSGNTGPGCGGGVFNSNSSSLTIHESAISGNRATGQTPNTAGGGIYNSSSSELELVNSTVSGNVSGYYGGGVHQAGSSGTTAVTILHCTITANRAARGGGICNLDDDSTVSIQGTIVAGNAAAIDSPDLCSFFTSFGCNLVADGSGGEGAFLDSDLHGGEGGPALDAMLGPLWHNGGPTRTHALLPGSPAIDAVPVSHGVPATDQRGQARPYNDLADIGAFEVPEPATLSLLALAGVASLRPPRRRAAVR